jgi:hypothetical protein
MADREDEIYAVYCYLPHHFDAVGLEDLVGEAALLYDCYACGCHA